MQIKQFKAPNWNHPLFLALTLKETIFCPGHLRAWYQTNREVPVPQSLLTVFKLGSPKLFSLALPFLWKTIKAVGQAFSSPAP